MICAITIRVGSSDGIGCGRARVNPVLSLSRCYAAAIAEFSRQMRIALFTKLSALGSRATCLVCRAAHYATVRRQLSKRVTQCRSSAQTETLCAACLVIKQSLTMMKPSHQESPSGAARCMNRWQQEIVIFVFKK